MVDNMNVDDGGAEVGVDAVLSVVSLLRSPTWDAWSTAPPVFCVLNI